MNRRADSRDADPPFEPPNHSLTRLQRALTAALGRTVGIDGVFGSGATQAVRDYQSSRGLAVDCIVGAGTWGALQAGR
ncbi:peptidoglycan-binding protein [Streptomyces sp. TRM72054]|nr:peptidoglycan-binding protein [Streptomyces sp. TRM72054]